jgi:hypothetical protein
LVKTFPQCAAEKSVRQSITSDSTRLVHLQEALAEAGAEPARIVALPMGGTLVL